MHSNNPLSNLPPITRMILIAMVVMFLLQAIMSQVNPGFMTRYFALFSFSSPYFYPWQLLTSAFLHGNLMHLFFNGLVLWMLGSQVENYWREKRYALFILVCIIGSSMLSALFNPPFTNSIGISGAVYGVLVAFAMMWPNHTLQLIIPPVAIKAKYFVMILAGIAFISSIDARQDGIGHLAHLGGAITGFLLIQYWRNKPPFKW